METIFHWAVEESRAPSSQASYSDRPSPNSPGRLESRVEEVGGTVRRPVVPRRCSEQPQLGVDRLEPGVAEVHIAVVIADGELDFHAGLDQRTVRTQEDIVEPALDAPVVADVAQVRHESVGVPLVPQCHLRGHGDRLAAAGAGVAHRGEGQGVRGDLPGAVREQELRCASGDEVLPPEQRPELVGEDPARRGGPSNRQARGQELAAVQRRSHALPQRVARRVQFPSTRRGVAAALRTRKPDARRSSFPPEEWRDSREHTVSVHGGPDGGESMKHPKLAVPLLTGALLLGGTAACSEGGRRRGGRLAGAR
jgi:hypothetical protein